MKTYVNNFNLLCFSIGGVDYILNKGDKAELPADNPIVKNYVHLKYLEEDKPPKTQK